MRIKRNENYVEKKGNSISQQIQTYPVMIINEFEKVDLEKPADQKLKVDFLYTFFIKPENKTRVVICGSYENKSGVWVSYNYQEELCANKNKPDFKYPLIELKVNEKPLSKIFKIVLIKGCYAILCQI